MIPELQKRIAELEATVQGILKDLNALREAHYGLENELGLSKSNKYVPMAEEPSPSISFGQGRRL